MKLDRYTPACVLRCFVHCTPLTSCRLVSCLVAVQCHAKFFYFLLLQCKINCGEKKCIDGKSDQIERQSPQLRIFIICATILYVRCLLDDCWEEKKWILFRSVLLLSCGWSFTRTAAGLNRRQRQNSPRKWHQTPTTSANISTWNVDSFSIFPSVWH